VVVEDELISCAEQCVCILSNIWDEGKTSEGSLKNKIKKRTIEEEYFWLRDKDKELCKIKCKTIEIEDPNDIFTDMYNIHACPELGVEMVALRRILCGCKACYEQIRKPWIPKINNKISHDLSNLISANIKVF